MIFQKLDRNWSKLTAPMSWRTTARRRFLLALPFSAPLWLLTAAALLILFTIREFTRPIRSFWSAPPRRRRNGYYHHRSGHSAAAILLEMAPRQEAA